MDFIDTHAHLYAEEFDLDRDEMMNRSLEAGVSKILLPNIDIESIDGLLALADKFPHNCFPMMGLHPCSVKENYQEELAAIKRTLFNGRKYVAVGEIGIDLYWDKSRWIEQQDAFITQCGWATELSLPIAIHTRNATRETLDCLGQLQVQPGGVFHCFGGSLEEANEIISLGYALGIGGVVTYKNSNLPEILKNIDIKHILLETDAPYLSPVPYRGKRNESSYIPIIAETLSKIYNLPLDEIAEITTANSKKLFSL